MRSDIAGGMWETGRVYLFLLTNEIYNGEKHMCEIRPIEITLLQVASSTFISNMQPDYKLYRINYAECYL